MSAQLEQILAHLDRPGVTGLVIGINRPLTVRKQTGDTALTTSPVTAAQFQILLKGSALAVIVPTLEGNQPPLEVVQGARRLKVHASRRGDEIVLRIERAPEAATSRAVDGLELTPELPFARPRRSTRGALGGAAAAAGANAPRAKRISLTPMLGQGAGRAKRATRASILAELAAQAPSGPEPEPVAVEAEFVPPAITFKGAAAPATPAAPIASPAATAPQPPTSRARNTRSQIRAPGAHPTFGELIQRAKDRGASDLHIAAHRAISLRVHGELVPIDPGAPVLEAADADALLRPLLTADQQDQLATAGYVDLALPAPGGGRLRANISKFQGGIKGTFRLARERPPTLAELGLPAEVGKLVHHHQGLIVIAGPSGHGKTTTLAALVDQVNETRPFHIITVEDPIEIVYPRKAAVVSQREVGPHTRSFAAALKGSLREDPDVIVIGELRDRETVEIALTAAETGHLVIATMSTPSAAKTIDRLVDMFPPEDQSQVRASIAGALRAIIAQRLVPSAGGDGVVAAVEVLTSVLALSAMIRDDKLYQLPNLMQRGRAFGMIRFDDSLTELVRAGKITIDVAIATSENKKELASQLRGGAPEAAAAAAAPPDGKAPRGRLAGLFGKKDA